MSDTLSKINQELLNSIQESKNRLRKLGEEITGLQAKSHENTQWIDRIKQVLKNQN